MLLGTTKLIILFLAGITEAFKADSFDKKINLGTKYALSSSNDAATPDPTER